MNTTKAEQIIEKWYLGHDTAMKASQRHELAQLLIQYSTEQNKELVEALDLLRQLRRDILATDYNEHWESFKALEAYLDAHPAALLAQHSEKGEK